MNRFNKAPRNNVKEKTRVRRERSKNRAVARASKAAPDDPRPAIPTARLERLAVSGKRTGKSKRKLLRKWQKARVVAVESGAVSMEDIVMYAAATASGGGGGPGGRTAQTKESDSMEVQEVAQQGRVTKGASSGAVVGFRVKPSKKARLQLKRRGLLPGKTSAAGNSEEMVE